MDFFTHSLFISLCLSAFHSSVFGRKTCTTIPPELSSHTVQYQLFKSNNLSWRDEEFEDCHLTPTDDSVWSNLRPEDMDGYREEFSWDMLYRRIKNSGSSGELKFLKDFSLQDVQLSPDSLHGQAQQTNLEYLLMLDVDSLVWSFRKTAGIATPGKPYGGWEDPTVQLRGHFVGHYLSATAHLWANTQNSSLLEKMSGVIAALNECQGKMGTGYLSAFPPNYFDRLEALRAVWAPYYTIHKIMTGLLDQYLFAGNSQTLQMLVWMADYFGKRVENVITKYSFERHWEIINVEFGGMNDVLYRLYTVTRDPKHLVLAHLFDKPCFLGLLAVQADSISQFHANAHVPVIVGSQKGYEITGDHIYKGLPFDFVSLIFNCLKNSLRKKRDWNLENHQVFAKTIGTYFMDIVNSSHCYATGGTSVSEHWTDPKRLATTLGTENEESCTTYNMLKVSRNLFRWTKEIAYADHYERALTNGVLGIQRGREPGVMIFTLPLGKGVSKAQSQYGWGTKFDSFWCCYGTGIESFSKLGDSIYFEEESDIPTLYVIQYISSSLNWTSGQIVLNQKAEPFVSLDPNLRVTFTFSAKEGESQLSTINLRIPFWTQSNGSMATLNGQSLPLSMPGTFMPVTKNWSSSDILTIQLPITLRLEAIEDDRPDYATVQAILFGPYLLAGLSDGGWDLQTGPSTSLSDWITQIPASYNSALVSLTQEVDSTLLVFTNSQNLIKMEEIPEPGTDSVLHATFRLILADEGSSQFSSVDDIIGRSIMLEPFNLPGMVVAMQGSNATIAKRGGGSDPSDYLFRVSAGLDNKNNTFSLESEFQQACFLCRVDDQVELRCFSGDQGDAFFQAASFTFSEGLTKYHPTSFMANGVNSSFLLVPLLSLRDESYTAYFNITSWEGRG